MDRFLPQRRRGTEDGVILIEALLLVILILITTVAFAQIIPAEFSFQRSMEDRSAVRDVQNGVSSWATANIAPAVSPFDAVARNEITFHTPAPACSDGVDNDDPSDGQIDYPADSGCQDASDNSEGTGSPATPPRFQPNTCYDVKVNPDSSELQVAWDSTTTPAGDFGSCPDATVLENANSRTIATDIVNDESSPLFNYYSSVGESSPILAAEINATSDPSCHYSDAPQVAPSVAVGAPAAGGPTGTFIYAVLFAHSDGRGKFTPDLIDPTKRVQSSPVTVNQERIEVSNIPPAPPSDVGVVGRHLYRQEVDGNDHTWYRVDQIANNSDTAYSDPDSQATVVSQDQAWNPTSSWTVLGAGRCAKSITLKTEVDIPGDLLLPTADRFRLLMSGTLASSAIGSYAVRGPDIGAPLTPDRIADDTLGPKQLGGTLTTVFGNVPLVNGWRQNYAPTAAAVGEWHGNAQSPSVTTSSGDLSAGNDHAATVVDWSSLCKKGYTLEARGRFTILNADSSSSSVGVRLVGAPTLTASSSAVGAGHYKTVESPWEIVDWGACKDANYLLGSSPFLYKLQSKSDSQGALAIVNANIELRWSAEQQPAEQDPETPQVLSPLSDSSAAAPLILTARFVDPNPDDLGKLSFQICPTGSCASQLGEQLSRQMVNGASYSWSTAGITLQAGQDYYWRVRGKDSSGQTGPWSAVVRVHVT